MKKFQAKKFLLIIFMNIAMYKFIHKNHKIILNAEIIQKNKPETMIN